MAAAGGGGGSAGGRAAVTQLKRALRQTSKERVLALTDGQRRAASASVAAQLAAREDYAAASRVAVFLSMPTEVDTEPIIANLLLARKQCFVPRFEPGSTDMDMFSVSSAEDLASLPRGKWGIRQPEHDLDQREAALAGGGGVDLVLVPGVAFTSSGHRCGHGKGYYDRFLRKLFALAEERGRPRPAAVGVAFATQRFDEVPTDEFDVLLDAVVFGR